MDLEIAEARRMLEACQARNFIRPWSF